MYSFAEIQKDIENNLTLMGEDVVEGVIGECRQILLVNLEEAIPRIKTIRSQYKNTQPLPLWFRKLVFEGIYNYLCSGVVSEQYQNQTEILKAMGLSVDIFSKHWKMYSPDMKYNQRNYANITLPLNHAEVEGNAIFRAMLHHMIFCADIPTDSFIDMYGKMGVVPALCANGYKRRVVFVKNTVLCDFQEALNKPVKVYKLIKEVQDKIEKLEYQRQKEKIVELLNLYMVRIDIWSRYEKECPEIDLYEFAAEYFLQNCFMPEYWLDSKLELEKVTKKVKGNIETKIKKGDLDSAKITHKRVKQFLNMKKEDFLEFAKAFKKLKIIEASAEGYVRELASNSLLNMYNMLDNYDNPSELLYIDLPKYIREFVRFHFNEMKTVEVFDMLGRYSGNWILVWKNYVEKYEEGSVYYELYSEEIKRRKEERVKRNVGMSKTDREKALKEARNPLLSMRRLLKILKNAESSKPIYVFKYRDDDKNTPNSILFITNIPVKDISEKDFITKYGLVFAKGGRLIIETLDSFCKKSGKFK